MQYLLVVSELDECPELVSSALGILRRDPEAKFVLLVPATPLPALDALFGEFTTPTRAARRRAQRMRTALQAARVPLAATRLGNRDPVRAVEDALRFSRYAAVVVACPARRLMHRLHLDLPCRLAARFPQTAFIHVTGTSRDRGSDVSDLRLERSGSV